MKKLILSLYLAVAIGFMTAVALCAQALNSPQTVASFYDGGMKIVLDAGHGGIDGGVTGKTTGVKESELNLSVTMALKDALEDMGFEVTLTRKTSAGLYGAATKGFKRRDMQKRKEIIEKADPALVLSIHQNFYPSRSSRGAQVFYNRLDERGKRLALKTQERLNEFYQTEGAKPRNAMVGEYFMLECSSAPSIIVECGFLSNESDEKLLTSERGQKRLVSAIAAGVIEYLSDSVA